MPAGKIHPFLYCLSTTNKFVVSCLKKLSINNHRYGINTHLKADENFYSGLNNKRIRQ